MTEIFDNITGPSGKGIAKERKFEVPAILLKVEEPNISSRLELGHSIAVSGWVLATEPIESVVAEVGGVTKFARFGLHRPDLAKVSPGESQIANSGFQCFIHPFFDPRADRLNVTVQTRSGLTRHVQVPLNFAKLENRKTLDSSGDKSDEAVKLHIETAQIDPAGLLRVSGWVVAYERISRVNIYVNDRLIGEAEYGFEREDVALAWPDYPHPLNSGYALITDGRSLPKASKVKVVVYTETGIIRELIAPIQQLGGSQRRREIAIHRLECDKAILQSSGHLILEGWAVSSAGIKHIDVIFEGELAGALHYGHERPDVGNLFPTIPGSRQSGFSFCGEIDRAKLLSEHVVELWAYLNDSTKHIFKVPLVPQQISADPTREDASDTILFIDEPIIKNGHAINPVAGGFSLVGWCLGKEGIESIVVEMDGTKVGNAYYGMRREDIEAAFPDRAGALLSGFAFSLPGRALTAGLHNVVVRARDKTSAEALQEFTIDVNNGLEPEGPWSLRRRLPAAERLLIESFLRHLPLKPVFFISISRCSNRAALNRTLLSLSNQIFEDWRIACPTKGDHQLLQNLVDRNFTELKPNMSPSAALLIEELSEHFRANNIWMLSLEAGDELAIDALSEFALAGGSNSKTDFIYADERRENLASHNVEAFFKPDWSPDLLASTNYLGKAWCVRFDLFQKLHLQVNNFNVAQKYEFALFCTDNAASITHISSVLLESYSGAVSFVKEKAMLEQAIKRRGLPAKVLPGRLESTYRIQPEERPRGLVSIIVPTCAARGLVKTCFDSLKSLSTYKDFEIICIDNIREATNEWKIWLRENADIVVEISEPFNWSRFNNMGAAKATGSYLLFLNDDTEIIQPDWLEVMLDLVAQPGVGVVGPQLLYPDRKVQHAGLFLSGLGTARHAFRFCEADDPGYFGLALTQRNVIGVTGACMLMRRDVFDQIGGFAEEHAVVNNDLDFCLKAHSSGLRNVYTPNAQLIHHELVSRAHIKDVYDSTAFNSHWTSIFHSGDPFFHRYLSRKHDSYQYDAEPDQLVIAGHPYYLKRNVKNILAIKVDHIGDFITALPAFRRIKSHFPQCRLTVLAAPASVSLAMLEPAIDQVIPFEFFHARSGLGQKKPDTKKLEDLKNQLSLMKFDLAIDLRKHSETRSLLQHAGAEVVAGFDNGNAFPWLDIARSFEGDERFAEKHIHVADDMLSLIDQVASAGDVERGTIRNSDFEKNTESVRAKLADSGLYERALVCVHPAAGNELRQWPPNHFAALIDLLVETEDVNIAVIGSSDELEITMRMMEFVKYTDRVTSLIGALKLSELPYFIATCSLFIGNNSGPHHIAASVGVPTLGVHSGVVDPREWGPLGECGIAIKRDMTCSPCYLARAEDCHRGVACLNQLDANSVFSACRRLLHFG